MEYEVVLIDATESPIERPKKQMCYYSGKKKHHTIKTQVVVNKADGKIVCTSSTNGRRHDVRLFKESKLKIDPKIKAVVDTGYLVLLGFMLIQ